MTGYGHGMRHNRQAYALCKALELNNKKQVVGYKKQVNNLIKVLMIPDNTSTVIKQ